MDALRAEFDQMMTEQAAVLDARLEESEADARNAVLPISGGFLSGFCFFGGAYYYMIRDHRTREKAAAESQRQNARITDLYHRAPCGYHSLGPDGLFLAINDTELEWLGYRRDEVLLDLKMPRVDGIEVLRQIKSDPGLRKIPVVMLTSSAEEQDLIRSYDLGVNAYVVKPVDFVQFVSAVQKLGAFWTVNNSAGIGSVITVEFI